MDELFDNQLPGGRSPDIQLCIFPHLKEFLVIDLRERPSRVSLFHTEDVFVEEYFKIVEADFAEVLREDTDFPFSHLIDLPLRLEEIMRDTAMTVILGKLGVEVTDYPRPFQLPCNRLQSLYGECNSCGTGLDNGRNSNSSPYYQGLILPLLFHGGLC
jgi:hypothetical protein